MDLADLMLLISVYSSGNMIINTYLQVDYTDDISLFFKNKHIKIKYSFQESAEKVETIKSRLQLNDLKFIVEKRNS